MPHDHRRAIRTWRSLSCHLYCRSTSRWTPNHHLLEADPQTVLQGHCDCKPITVRTAEMSRQEKDAARSSQGNSDLAVPLLPSILPHDQPMAPGHSVRPALCTNSSACASVKCTHRTHSASHHKHGMGTNQVLLEQTAPPRATCAIGIECRVRDAVGIELLHSPRRNSMRHIRLAECAHQERTLCGGRARRTHRPGVRAAGADRAAAAAAQPAIRAAAGGQPADLQPRPGTLIAACEGSVHAHCSWWSPLSGLG